MSAHIHRVQVYYEDTDHSGAVYHANYLKYFERAREHLIGPAELVRLLREEDVGFVVYRAELTFKEAAVLGDSLEIRTTVKRSSPYRLSFHQAAWREGTLLVDGQVELVCVNGAKSLVKVPDSVPL